MGVPLSIRFDRALLITADDPRWDYVHVLMPNCTANDGHAADHLIAYDRLLAFGWEAL